jgi:hypothetical protein
MADRNGQFGSSEKSVFLCRRRAKPIRCEGSPIWETLAISYPIRCEPMPLDAPDHLSNLAPLATRPWAREASAKKKIRGPSASVGMTQNVPALSAAPEARPCVRDTSGGQAGEAIQEKDPGFFPFGCAQGFGWWKEVIQKRSRMTQKKP